MPAVPQTSEPPKLWHLKIDKIKIEFRNIPQKKIYATVSAVDEKGDNIKLVESDRYKKQQVIIWDIKQNASAMDHTASINVQVIEYHLRDKIRAKPKVVLFDEILENDKIANALMKQGEHGENQDISGQEFKLVNNTSGINVILTLSSPSLAKILEGFVFPDSTVLQNIAKYETALDMIMNIATAIGGLNQVAGAVVQIAKQAYEALKIPGKCHTSILNMFESMGDLLSAIQNGGPIRAYLDQNEKAQFKKILDDIFKIIDQAVNDVLSKYREPIAKQLFGSASLMQKATEYMGECARLKAQYQENLQNVGVWHILLLEMDHILDVKLAPEGHSGHKVCLKDTRAKLLSNLVADVLKNPIVWVYGGAGLGKSSISGSFTQMMKEMQDPRLACVECAISYYCTRDNRAKDVEKLVPTLAYHLALVFPAYRKRLAQDHNLTRDGDIEVQFKNLFHAPLNVMKNEGTIPTGKIIIIIDGLDEWGQTNDRQMFLNEVIKLCTNNAWMRFFITSRPNTEIHTGFASGDVLIAKNNLAEDPHIEEDIKVFVKNFWDKHPTMARYITKPQMMDLVPEIGGLFQYADVVCKFLAQNPSKNYGILTRKKPGFKSGKQSFGALHILYKFVLIESIDDPENELLDYVNVIGTLILLQKPLTLESLQEKFFPKIDVSKIVNTLLAVLYKDSEGKIRCHLSFQEFIFDQKEPIRDGQYEYNFVIDPVKQHIQIASTCVAIMKDQLEFNICHLETSHSLSELVDIETCVKNVISEELQYACKSWAYHLCSVAGDNQNMSWHEAAMFVRNKKIIYWMECLSCMNETLHIRDSMASLVKHSKNFEIKEAADDIATFISLFYIPIAFSTPHLYLSALPMIPQNSWLYGHVEPNLGCTIKVEQKGKNKLWNPQVNCINAMAPVRSIACSPDGQYIVSGSEDDTIRIWEAASGQLVGKPLAGHDGEVLSVAYSPNGDYIVSGSEDKTVRIWNVATRQQEGTTFLGHQSPVNSVSYSSDGQFIVSGSRDSTIIVWNAETRQLSRAPAQLQVEEHDFLTPSMAYSPKGHIVYASRSDNAVRIWDIEKGQQAAIPLLRHENLVHAVACSPDGKYIVSGSRSLDGTIRIWNTETGKPEGTPLGHDLVETVAYSPDGQSIVSGSDDGTIRIWDAQRQVSWPLLGHKDSVTSVAYFPDGSHVASGSDDFTIRIWNAVGKRLEFEEAPLEGHNSSVLATACSPNGQYIASGSENNDIKIWDATTGESALGVTLQGHSDRVNSLAYSSDGQYIVSGSSDGTIIIWNAETGLPMGKSPQHDYGIHSVSCSPSPIANHIASGCSDSNVRIWDAASCQLVGEPLRGHRGPVNSVAYSPDGQQIVSGSRDGAIRIWNAVTGLPVEQLEPMEHPFGVLSVAYSPNGHYIVSGSSEWGGILWDATNGQHIGHFFVRNERIMSVAYSPDSQYIVSGCKDGTVRIWDTVTNAQVGEPLEGHEGPVCTVSYSPDGKYIVSGSSDSTIRIWNAEVASWQADSIIQDKTGKELHNLNIDEQGWARSSTDDLLFWAPQQYRHGLADRRQILTIPADAPNQAVDLDTTDFVHGTEWQAAWKSN